MQDIEWLNRMYDVSAFFFEARSKAFVPFRLIRLFLSLLFAPKANILISFGGYHSFIAVCVARLKRKKSFIILNGTDSVAMPQIGYGYLRRGVIRYFCEWSYQQATALLPVSASLMYTENGYAFEPPLKLGVHQAFPYLKTPFFVVSNGFDISFWTEKSTVKCSENSFITVIGKGQEIRKGLDLIIAAASQLPNSIFYVAGHSGKGVQAPENVFFLGFLNRSELRKAYWESRYYLQLSLFEGFGCSLCEAMLCGCTPIVSNVNMLSEITCGLGEVLDHNNVEKFIGLVEILQPSSPVQCLDVIKNRFSMDNRINRLQEIIDQ